MIPNPAIFSQRYFRSVADFLVSIILRVSWAPSELCQPGQTERRCYEFPNYIMVSQKRFLLMILWEDFWFAVGGVGTEPVCCTVKCGLNSSMTALWPEPPVPEQMEATVQQCVLYVCVSDSGGVYRPVPPSDLLLGWHYCTLLQAFWKWMKRSVVLGVY